MQKTQKINTQKLQEPKILNIKNRFGKRPGSRDSRSRD